MSNLGQGFQIWEFPILGAPVQKWNLTPVLARKAQKQEFRNLWGGKLLLPLDPRRIQGEVLGLEKSHRTGH